MPGVVICGVGPDSGQNEDTTYSAHAIYPKNWRNGEKIRKLKEITAGNEDMQAGFMGCGGLVLYDLSQVDIKGGKESLDDAREFFLKYSDFSMGYFEGLMHKDFPYKDDMLSESMNISNGVVRGYGKGWKIKKGFARQLCEKDFIKLDAGAGLLLRAKF